MNDQQINQIPVPTPVVTKNIKQKVADWTKTLFTRFYSNKKLFWPVSISLGFLLLVVILGLIFGSAKKKKETAQVPSPTSQTQEKKVETPSQESSGKLEQKLKELNSQIINLDVNQKRLQLPTVNFKIQF